MFFEKWNVQNERVFFTKSINWSWNVFFDFRFVFWNNEKIIWWRAFCRRRLFCWKFWYETLINRRLSICSSIFKELQTNDFKNRKIVKSFNKIKRFWNFERSNRSFCDFVKSKIDCYDNDDCLYKLCWKILNERFVDSLKFVNNKDCKHDFSTDDIIVDVVKNEIVKRNQLVLSKKRTKSLFVQTLLLHINQKKKQKNFKRKMIKKTKKKKQNF